MNLILLESAEVAADGVVQLGDARAAHVIGVLKAAPGQTIRVGLLDGPHGTGQVIETRHGRVTLQCTFDAAAPPLPAIDLLLALPRPKVLRRLWAQLAALGVGRIMLTNAERVERNYFDTHVLDARCYRPLLVEGLQQARDTRLPAVTIHRQFKVLVEDHLDALSDAGTRLVADHRAHTPIRAAMRAATHGGTSERVLLAVGPEGGWNAFELDLLQAHRCQAVSMGPRTLRADTACVALLTLAHEAAYRR